MELDFSNIEIVGQILPGDPSVLGPKSFAENLEYRKTHAILMAWSANTQQEIRLRLAITLCIFGLIACETVALFVLVFMGAFGLAHVDTAVLSILIPAVFVKVVALGWLVVKYLFNEVLRARFDELLNRVGVLPDRQPKNPKPRGSKGLQPPE